MHCMGRTWSKCYSLLTVTKSSGSDGILTTTLKETALSIAPGITKLFLNRPVARIRITPDTLHGGVRKSRAGGPPLWRIVLTCDIRRHLGHLPGRVSAIEGVCRSVFDTVQHTVRHKRAEPSFVKKLAINTASVHFAIDKIRVVLQAWALIIRILYVTLLMTSRAMGLYFHPNWYYS